MKNNNRIIHVVGINSFEFEEFPYPIKDLIIKTKNIAAPNTFIEKIKYWISQKLIEDKIFFVSKSNLDLIEWLKSTNEDVILFSRGDPLWYGIGRILLNNFTQNELSFYPANTCIQLAFSKLKRPWQGIKAVSIHGRDSKELINSLKKKEKNIAILTDPKNKSLDLIRKNLKELNLENHYEFWLLEEIGLEQEKIMLIKNEDNLPQRFSGLNLVILLKKDIIARNSSLPLFGIYDDFYETFDDRPNLIKKREIRVQILADLELPEFGRLLDIGSGSGTIGLEAIRLRPKLELICFDKRFGSKSLIKANAKSLGVDPLKIIEGDVVQYLDTDFKEFLSNSNRIIIGGCKRETKISIIKYLSKLLTKDDIIVIPVITYEVLESITLTLKNLNFETCINLIQTYKGLSIIDGTRFEPNNPVFIIKAKKK